MAASSSLATAGKATSSGPMGCADARAALKRSPNFASRLQVTEKSVSRTTAARSSIFDSSRRSKTPSARKSRRLPLWRTMCSISAEVKSGRIGTMTAP